jgi:uncharacterized protein Yka (UPF0111/DUF47 family)
MRFSLLPRDDAFFTLFERSAATMVAAGQALQDLFAGPINEDRFKLLDDIEHDGDAITHEVVARLSRTFITPLDRDDTHRLIHVLDNVVDAAEAAGEVAVLCRIYEATPQARAMTEVLCEITSEVAKLVPYLRGGSGYRQHIVRAHELENQGDRRWTEAFASLFEGHYEPLDVVKWKEIYEQIEEAIDAAEEAAQIIEEIVYKQA